METIKRMSKITDRTLKLIHIAYAVLVFCITVYISLENSGNPRNIRLILIHVSAVFLVALLRHTVFKDNKAVKAVSPYIEIAIAVPLAFLTQSAVSLWFILLLNIDVIVDYNLKYSVFYSFAGYVIYITCYLIKIAPFKLPDGAMVFFMGAVQYSIIMSMGFVAKRYNEQNTRYKQLMAKQKASMLELEQMAVLKERNRMAGEIHDTVGHQLTTALVQLEATSIIIDKDISQAKKRLSLIREQVKTSLNELRSSIRQLKNENFDDFREMLTELVKKVKATTGIDVETNLHNAEDIPESARKAIYRMSMEAITNAIKHGRCNRIWLDVGFDAGHITVTVENDGIVPDEIDFGFGLNRMKERIEELDGIFMHGIGKYGFFVKAEINSNRRSD